MFIAVALNLVAQWALDPPTFLLKFCLGVVCGTIVGLAFRAVDR